MVRFFISVLLTSVTATFAAPMHGQESTTEDINQQVILREDIAASPQMVDAGLGSGASGSRFNPGLPKSGEKPTGAAKSGEKPTGAAGGPLPRETPTYCQDSRGTSCRARSRTPGKHRGTLSPSRAMSSNTRKGGLSPDAVDESQVRGDQSQGRGGSGYSQEPTSRRSRSRERERPPAQQHAENVPVPGSPVVDVHFTDLEGVRSEGGKRPTTPFSPEAKRPRAEEVTMSDEDVPL